MGLYYLLKRHSYSSFKSYFCFNLHAINVGAVLLFWRIFFSVITGRAASEKSGLSKRHSRRASCCCLRLFDVLSGSINAQLPDVFVSFVCLSKWYHYFTSFCKPLCYFAWTKRIGVVTPNYDPSL